MTISSGRFQRECWTCARARTKILLSQWSLLILLNKEFCHEVVRSSGAACSLCGLRMVLLAAQAYAPDTARSGCVFRWRSALRRPMVAGVTGQKPWLATGGLAWAPVFLRKATLCTVPKSSAESVPFSWNVLESVLEVLRVRSVCDHVSSGQYSAKSVFMSASERRTRHAPSSASCPPCQETWLVRSRRPSSR